MSDEPREPVGDHAEETETTEFEVVRPPEGVRERKELELIGHQRLTVREDFAHPIELRLGRDSHTPSLYVVRRPAHVGLWEYSVVQPEVVRSHPGRGWVESSETVFAYLGRGISPQFELGPDVSRHHCLLATDDAKQGGSIVQVENYGRNGTRVAIHPEDLIGVEAFDPDDLTWPDD